VSTLNPAPTIIIAPADVPWRRRAVSRRLSWRAARITNGNYLVLMKWYPGWMSAAHLRDGPFVRRAAGGVVVQ
jgi:hypothetical protein